jgi:hypothetical protein
MYWHGFGLDDRGIGNRFKRREVFLSSTAFRPAMGPTQSFQWVPGLFSPGVKKPGVKLALQLLRLRLRIYGFTPPFFHALMACFLIKRRDIIPLSFIQSKCTLHFCASINEKRNGVRFTNELSSPSVCMCVSTVTSSLRQLQRVRGNDDGGALHWSPSWAASIHSIHPHPL